MHWIMATLVGALCTLAACAAEGAQAAPARDAGDPRQGRQDAEPASHVDAGAAQSEVDLLRDGGSSARCEDADDWGLFENCPTCPGGECFSFSRQRMVRNACRCARDADCPCGLHCGCLEIAPAVLVCDVCTRTEGPADAGQAGAR